MVDIMPPDPDSKLDPLVRAHRAGMRAVSDMAFDWHCPWSARLPRRKCPDCAAKVALDTAISYLRGEA